MLKKVLLASLCSFFVFMGISYTMTVCREKENHSAAEAEVQRVLGEENRIRPDTKIVYQYFYTTDRVTKEQTEPAPDFLQGLDMEQLGGIYNGWQVVLFSPETVILRCNIKGLSSETYILGEQDGFLAVFYEDAQKILHLKEKTDLPLSALPEGEAKQIREGLQVTGEENLAKILSDLNS